MRIATIYFQLAIHIPAKSIVRNHSANSTFDQQLRMPSAACPDALRFVSAHVTRKTHITFLFFLLSGESNFFRVNDDDKISGVDVWGENRFLFSAQKVRSLYRNAAEYLVLGVNNPALP